ncbi:hypothetical protein Efla_000777 [Eimeria flavescens]
MLERSERVYSSPHHFGLQEHVSLPLNETAAVKASPRQMMRKLKMVSFALSALAAVTMLVICYRGLRTKIGHEEPVRALASERNGQRGADEFEQSMILDSCLDLQSEFAYTGTPVYQPLKEDKAIAQIASSIARDVQLFESSTLVARSSKAATLLPPDSPLPYFDASRWSVHQGSAYEYLSAGIAGSQQAAYWTAQSYQERLTPSGVHVGASNYHHQSIQGYENLEFSPQPSAAAAPGTARVGLSDLTLFSSAAETLTPLYEIPGPSGISQTGAQHLMNARHGVDHPQAKTSWQMASGGGKEAQGEHKTKKKVENLKRRIHSDSGIYALGAMASPDSTKQSSTKKPRLSTGDLDADWTTLEVAGKFMDQQSSSKLLEAGAVIVHSALEEPSDASAQPGYVAISMRSGEEIRITHPPPPMPENTHTYFRLPKIKPSTIATPFDMDLAFGPVKIRTVCGRLLLARSLLAQKELTAADAFALVGACQEIVNYLTLQQKLELDNVFPSRATDRLGMRYLCFDVLVSAIQLLGPSMKPQAWFPKLVELVPAAYSFNILLRNSERAQHFLRLSEKLSGMQSLTHSGSRRSKNAFGVPAAGHIGREWSQRVLRQHQQDGMHGQPLCTLCRRFRFALMEYRQLSKVLFLVLYKVPWTELCINIFGETRRFAEHQLPRSFSLTSGDASVQPHTVKHEESKNGSPFYGHQKKWSSREALQPSFIPIGAWGGPHSSGIPLELGILVRSSHLIFFFPQGTSKLSFPLSRSEARPKLLKRLKYRYLAA